MSAIGLSNLQNHHPIVGTHHFELAPRGSAPGQQTPWDQGILRIQQIMRQNFSPSAMKTLECIKEKFLSRSYSEVFQLETVGGHKVRVRMCPLDNGHSLFVFKNLRKKKVGADKRLSLGFCSDTWEVQAILSKRKKRQGLEESLQQHCQSSSHVFPIDRVIDYQTDGKNARGGRKEKRYLVTQLCERGDLVRVLQKEKIGEHQRHKWALQLAKSLAGIHSKKVAHLDLKLENILIDARDDLWVTDFGEAVNFEGLKHLDCAQGTVGYMSPEMIQLLKQKTEITEKTDIWSLGVVLVGIWTGCGMHAQKQCDAAIKDQAFFNLWDLERSFQEDVERLYTYWGRIDKWQKDLLQRIFRADPQARPSAEEVYSILETHLLKV